jgi:hypothetical protein
MPTFELGALDIEVRKDAVEPLRDPPGGSAQQVHDRRHQQEAHDEGIRTHAESQSETKGDDEHGISAL